VPPCRRRQREPRAPRERCVSPTSATDSRHEHPADRSIPGYAHRVSYQVEPRLTANLQLQSLPQPSRDALRGGDRTEPRLRTLTCVARRGPGGASIEGSSAPSLPPAVFSTAGRACDTTSDVPLRPRRIRYARERLRTALKRRIPTASGRWPGPDAVSSKTTADPRQDAFHRRVLPPPSTHAACAGTRGIKESPPPVSLLARWWLSPPRPGFRRAFAPRARPLARGAGELDPEPSGLDRAPLVDFCNQRDPRAPPPIT